MASLATSLCSKVFCAELVPVRGMYLTETLSCRRTCHSRRTSTKYCSHGAWDHSQVHSDAHTECKNGELYLLYPPKHFNSFSSFYKGPLRAKQGTGEACCDNPIPVRRSNCHCLLIDTSYSYTHGLFSHGPHFSGEQTDAEGELGEMKPGIRWL